MTKAPIVASPILSARSAYILLGLVIVIWGTNWPIMKSALNVVPPLWFAFGRTLIGALTLIALLAWKGQLRLPPRHDLPVVFSVGFLHLALFLGFVNIALQFVGAGRSAILAYTTPLWVVPGAIWFLGERMTRLKAAGLVAGLGGLIVLFNPAALDWSDRNVLIGNGLLLVAALFWAVAIVHIRGHKFQLTTFQLTPWQLIVGGVPLLIAALIFEDTGRIVWNGEMWFALAYNGFLSTAFGYWAAVTVNRAIPAITMSLGILGVPLVGLVTGIFWLGEEAAPSLMISLLLIGLGLTLVAWADRPGANIRSR
ncbi:MAG: DMT family transporter [Alphaproteobacteria bacterium]